MKRIALAAALLGALFFSARAQPSVRAIYRAHKRADGDNFHFMLPRPVFWLGSLFLKSRDERKLLRSVRNARILVIDGGSSISPLDMAQMLHRAEKAGFEPLLTIKNGPTRVSINVKERKNKIRGLFITMVDEGDFVLLSLKTKLDMKNVERLLERLSKEKKLKNAPLPLPKIPEKARA